MSWYHACRENGLGIRSRVPATIAAALVAAGAVATSAAAITAASPPDGSGNYSYQTRDNSADPTFNQLLGINESGLIAGYYGSGAAGHPNKGYLLSNFGHGSYKNENFPHSKQTQVTGLNNLGVTVGFWVNKKGVNHGFYAIHGHHFTTADYPTTNPANPAIDQLLGVNDQGVAVGFYNDSKGNSHGYTFTIAHKRYRKVGGIGGATSVTATGINDEGDISGFETDSGGAVVGFLKLSTGRVFTLSVPGASMTQAFGLNAGDEVVGAYEVGTGSTAKMHGFTWAPGFGFENVDDPSGVGATIVNGVNNRGWLVGFYTDSAGNTDGFIAKPLG